MIIELHELMEVVGRLPNPLIAAETHQWYFKVPIVRQLIAMEPTENDLVAGEVRYISFELKEVRRTGIKHWRWSVADEIIV